MRLSIESTTQKGIEIVHLEGTVDMYNATDLREALNTILNQGKTRIIIDVLKVVHIDSSAFAVIVSINNLLNKKGNRLRVLLDRKKTLLFHHFNLDDRMGLHYSLEGALNSF
jgi:anti-sigma B factor antagonist